MEKIVKKGNYDFSSHATGQRNGDLNKTVVDAMIRLAVENVTIHTSHNLNENN